MLGVPGLERKKSKRPSLTRRKSARLAVKLSADEHSAIKKKLQAAAYSTGGVDWHKLFRNIDRDNSGALDSAEFVSTMHREAKLSTTAVSDEALHALLAQMDVDASVELDADQFVAWLYVREEVDEGRPAFLRRKSVRTMQMSDTDVLLLKKKLRSAAYNKGKVDWHKLFKKYDSDNSGELDAKEFVTAIQKDAKHATKSRLTDELLYSLFERIDADGGGELDADEFVAWLNDDRNAFKKKKKKARISIHR
jgi:Ca2+-binding EF-hand superfamily protein